MGESPNAQANASNTIANVADRIVGDIILGGIGRVAYHAQKVPGLGHAMRYVGENVRDGYVAAQTADYVRKAVSAIREVQAQTGLTLTCDQMRMLAREAGVREEDLDRVLQAAEEAANGGVSNPAGFGTTAVAGA